MRIDVDLVEKARCGDVEAFSEIYDSIKDELYKYALYTLGNSCDAEDAVSETFFEAYRGIRRLNEPKAFKSWIFRILSIRCKRKISEYVKVRGNCDIDDFIDLSDEKSGDISERSELLGALSTLSPEERMIVILSALHGYTTLEISRILNKPHGTISSKLCRTYAKLRTILEKE